MRALLLVAAITVPAVLGASGIALAYWHSSGSGTGSAPTGAAAALILAPATPAASLYPGGQADVTLTVSNPNTTVVNVAALALDTSRGTGGFAVDGTHAACDTAALSFVTQTNEAAGWSVPAKSGTADGTLAISLPNALAMDADAANSCQGAHFTVYLVASP